jgi:ABC-type multidrug transport system permease subunit
MFLLLNPITIIVAILPALEKAGVWLLIAITFPIAAVISILFVLVSYLAHNPLVLIGFICLSIFAIVAVALVLYLIDKRRDQEIPTESE